MNNKTSNSEKRAVALSYNETVDTAPRLVAKGKGIVADNILEKAKLYNIPIQEDPALVELLGELYINESIPEELYQVVAEIFAFIYKVDRSVEEC